MIQFGTGGWRAIIGDEFIRTNIQQLSRALAQKMKEEGVNEKGIIIGYDRRFLSKEAMQWCGEVFAAEGIIAKLVNSSVPTSPQVLICPYCGHALTPKKDRKHFIHIV